MKKSLKKINTGITKVYTGILFITLFTTLSLANNGSIPNATLSIKNETELLADLLATFPVIPKEKLIFDTSVINLTGQSIAEALTVSGYPFGRVTSEIKETDTAKKILFIVEPGPLCSFDKPLINRDLELKRRVLLSDFEFQAGDTFNRDKIKETLYRLELRDYIESVEVGTPGLRPKKTIDEEKKDTIFDEAVTVPVKIKENSGFGVEGILGYSSQEKGGLEGSGKLLLLNILHLGEALEIEYKGEETYQNLNFFISKAYPFGIPLILSGQFIMEIEEDQYGYIEGEGHFSFYLKNRWESGIGFKAYETNPIDERSWYYGGVDFFVRRYGPLPENNLKTFDFVFNGGSGLKNYKGDKLNRFNFTTKLSGQLPTFKNQSIISSIFGGALNLNNEKELHLTELIDMGGPGSVRGYNEREFYFSSALALTFQYNYYFRKRLSAYIFADGALGTEKGFTLKSVKGMFGYGLGFNIPVRKGRLSIEWARNYKDRRNPGRIHLNVMNSLGKKRYD